jgi:hypothetical protein
MNVPSGAKRLYTVITSVRYVDVASLIDADAVGCA